MAPRQTFVAVAILVSGLASPGPGAESEKPFPATTRAGIESLEGRLDKAVARVSLPHVSHLLGRGATARGYRLPGYGIVFVLTPRALPGGESPVFVLRRGSPTHRRLRVDSRGPGPQQGATEDEEQIEALERQVLVLQHETESARRAAEEDLDRIVQDVRVRVAPPAVHVEVGSEEPPPAPEAPAVPVPPAPPNPAPAPLPPAPPWKFWFPTELPQDQRDPAAVVADVRVALVDALAAEGGRLSGLGGDERVTVAVDFVVGGIFVARARPEKTLVVSARVKDVQARARRAISAEELRKRVEVTEY
jgi:hypothetical protein